MFINHHGGRWRTPAQPRSFGERQGRFKLQQNAVTLGHVESEWVSVQS